MSKPDPKPAARRRRRIRTVDPGALRRAHASPGRCAGCGRQPWSVHHIVPKGSPHFGDDVEENFLTVCGHGTYGCHGALHGIPYVDEDGKRWTPEEVRRAVGKTIAASRLDTIFYVLSKLGDEPGRDWLRRRYFVELPPA